MPNAAAVEHQPDTMADADTANAKVADAAPEVRAEPDLREREDARDRLAARRER